MGYQERIEVIYKRQDLVTSDVREIRYLRVQLLEVGPDQFIQFSRGPEISEEQYERVMALRAQAIQDDLRNRHIKPSKA